MEIAQLLDHVHELPPAARVLPRLQRLLRSDDASAEDIIRLLKVDASLTAQVLRFSNSAYFCGGMPCDSIDQAIQRLGFRTVYQLVATAASQPLFDPPIELYGFERGELLVRSVALALFGQALNRHLRFEDEVEALYTAGLLHGIGKVAINQYFQRKGFEIYDLRDDQPLDADFEKRLVGFTYAEAGAALLEHWKFSPAIVELIRFQNEPEAAPQHPMLTRILALGLSVLPALLDNRLSPAAVVTEADDSLLEFDPEQLEASVEKVRADLADLARLF
ncbi:MAG: HDOD domain-containing protein [Opitutales bacterium]